MATKLLDGNTFKTLVANGYQNLINDIDRINALNVFPVPDGDTGTNMKLTLEGGVKAIALENQSSIGVLAKKLSRAMTMSARGNSGVILSQFFKGLSNGLENKDCVNSEEIVNAFDFGVKQAYKVVQKPTEGTMLTVMREATQMCKENIHSLSSIEDFFACFIKEAHASLERTPHLLPVLKEAGVIDSGGAGYNRIIEGMILALDGNILVAQEEYEKVTSQTTTHGHFDANSVLEYGYCTEFILQLQNSKVDIKSFDIKEITCFLETIGDSIVAFKDDDIVKVHVHTFTPGEVINYCQKFGEYITFKMENMSVQHSELESIPTEVAPKVHKKFAVVAVSSSEGISKAFKEMGCDIIVSGGQTMNPSSEDFIAAFQQIDAENIIVFPNNGNIIMAAKQAAELYEQAKVKVILTHSMAECYSALTMLDYSSDDLDSIVENFQMVIDNVTYASITYAIRDSLIDHVEIKKDDFMAFVNGKIVAARANKVDVFKQLFAHVENMEDKEVVTIIYGKDVTESEKDEVLSFIHQTYPLIEIGEVEGMQEIYSFILSIE